MSRYLKISIVSIILSICVHIYLSFHYYHINYNPDLEGSSCNISATFNCDFVALSDFAAIMGIPISLFGGLVHLLLLLIVSSQALKLTHHPKVSKSHGFCLSTFIALISVVMGLISLSQLSSYCIFCIGAYILSFITLVALWMDQKQYGQAQDSDPQISFLEAFHWKQSKGFIIMLLAIPLIAFIFHRSLLKNAQGEYGQKANILIKRALSSWKSNPKSDFSAIPSLIKGPGTDKAKVTIVEFADFLCSHCKKAAAHLKTFSNSHPDVRFEFYNFPRGGCPKETSKANGFSCHLAKAVHCSQEQGSSWLFHDLIFKNQRELSHLSLSEADNLLKFYTEQSQLDWTKLRSCMDLASTREALLAQIENAKTAKVTATPTIYVNGRKLPHGPITPILSKIYKSIK